MLLNITFAILIFCIVGIVFSTGVLYGFHTYRAIDDECLKDKIKIYEDYKNESNEQYRVNMKILNDAKERLQRAEKYYKEVEKIINYGKVQKETSSD